MPQNNIDEIVKIITSVEWRTNGTKSEARRMLNELRTQILNEVEEKIREEYGLDISLKQKSEEEKE